MMLPLILFLFCVLFSCFIFAEGPLLLLLLPPRVRPCFLRVVVVAVFADGVASLSSLFFVFFFVLGRREHPCVPSDRTLASSCCRFFCC